MDNFDRYLADPIVNIISNFFSLNDIIKQNDLRAFKGLNKEEHTEITVDTLASFNRIDMMKHLHKIYPEHFTEKTMTAAIRNNHLESVKWLFSIGKYSQKILDRAADYGNLKMVKFFIKNGMTATSTTLDMAASEGCLSVVRYLHKIKIPFSDTLLDCAIYSGKLKLVKYVYENITKFYNRNGISQAIKSGNTKILKYLHEQSRFIIDTEAVTICARRNYHKTLQFLYKNHYRFNYKESLEIALHCGNYKIVKLLKKYIMLLDDSNWDYAIYPIFNHQSVSKIQKRRLIKSFRQIINNTQYAPFIINYIVRIGTIEDVRYLFINYNGKYSKDIIEFAKSGKDQTVIDFVEKCILPLLENN
jgi:hypothetical protein